RHQFLPPFGLAGQRPAAKPLGWFAFAVATPVLVLRAPRGVHRNRPRLWADLACALGFLPQTRSRLQGNGGLPFGDWFPELHGLGTSHVRQRDEPLFRLPVLDPDADYHHTRYHRLLALAGDGFWRQTALQYCNDVCLGLRVGVCDRRFGWHVPGAALARYLSPRNLLRRRTFPHGHGSGGDLRYVRRYLLLVPEDVWPHDE